MVYFGERRAEVPGNESLIDYGDVAREMIHRSIDTRTEGRLRTLWSIDREPAGNSQLVNASCRSRAVSQGLMALEYRRLEKSVVPPRACATFPELRRSPHRPAQVMTLGS